MKKILLSLAVAALAAVTSPAQTAVDPADPAHTSFFTSVQNYFTSYDTNLDGVLPTHKGTLGLAQCWQGGAHSATALGLGYEVWNKFSLESETVFEDITGNVQRQHLGLGYNIDIHDVRLTGYAMATARVDESKFGAALGLRASKLLTEHTFLSTAIEVPIENGGGHVKPVLKFGTGFLF